MCVCVCLCSARRCWLFLLESCCVSGPVTAVSSANVISCSVGCESISFRGTITEDCRFFSILPIITFESNHCALLNIQCQNQNTSAAQSCDHVKSMTGRFQEKSSCLETAMFVSVSLSLKPQQNIPPLFLLFFCVSINTTHDLSEPWIRAFTLFGQGSQTIRGWMGDKASHITRIKNVGPSAMDREPGFQEPSWANTDSYFWPQNWNEAGWKWGRLPEEPCFNS